MRETAPEATPDATPDFIPLNLPNNRIQIANIRPSKIELILEKR